MLPSAEESETNRALNGIPENIPEIRDGFPLRLASVGLEAKQMSFLPDETSLLHRGNAMQTNMHEIEISSPIHDFLTTVAAATRKLINRLAIQEELDLARQLLESLPFSTEEYGLACNRLRNAGRFAKSDEYGAASWELKTLKSWVLRQENTPAASPRRRRWMQSV